MEEILKELQRLKELTLLSAKSVLTMNDVADLTGLSKSHIYRLVCKRQIPYYKSAGGKFTYFNKAEIEGWLMAHRVPTIDEAEAEAVNYVVSNKKRERR